jgi:hypothetical protein
VVLNLTQPLSTRPNCLPLSSKEVAGAATLPRPGLGGMGIEHREQPIQDGGGHGLRKDGESLSFEACGPIRAHYVRQASHVAACSYVPLERIGGGQVTEYRPGFLDAPI